MSDSTEPPDSRPLRELLRIAGQPCAKCGGACPPTEALCGITLGFKDAPRCLACLCTGLGRERAELQAQLAEYIQRNECYQRAWDEAVRLEATEPPVPVAVPPDLFWDAGDLGCGDLVLALRVRLAGLPAGTVLRVRATDPAAPEDIPAWCRLTGHPLVAAEPPVFFVRRKGD